MYEFSYHYTISSRFIYWFHFLISPHKSLIECSVEMNSNFSYSNNCLLNQTNNRILLINYSLMIFIQKYQHIHIAWSKTRSFVSNNVPRNGKCPFYRHYTEHYHHQFVPNTSTHCFFLPFSKSFRNAHA